MKNLFIIIALTIGFSMNAQLAAVTESSNTGQRLSTSSAANHGNIGNYAVDLSFSSSSSSTRGATGSASTAMGQNSTASGSYSTAIGNVVSSIGDNSTAMGVSSTANGYGSTAIGERNTTNGNRSTAMGYYTTTSDFGSFAIGTYNNSLSSVTTNGSATAYDADNTAFVIGNGTGAGASASDAFKVMFNGDATVSNDLTVSGDVVVSSDARLKSNIVSLGSTLSRLLLIDGKTYTMKKDGKQKIGVLAQDIQKVFPELVSEDDNEMLAVNYQGLVPVLINALKEQQSDIETYRNEVSELKEMVKQLISSK